ncbi:MAG: hypothetical protein ORN56_07100 [Chitinophagales bacterium]|nr:hypothetical protein [Chitinophagales bacterium]
MKKLVVSLFMLLSTFASLYSNAQEAAVKIDGKQVFFKSGISLPYWLNAGQTIAPSNNVSFLSCVQFIADTTNHSLKFDQVLKISTLANVPAGKVWKIEALAFDTLVVPTNTNSIQVPNNWGTNGTSVGSSSNSTNIPTLYKSPKIYSTPGTYQWVVPPGVTTICVEIWGGGGRGGDIGSSFSSTCSGGGGAGGYGYQCISVTPNQSFSFLVGASDQASTFGSILTANAGGAGTNNNTVLFGLGGTCNAAFNVKGEDANLLWRSGGSAYSGGIGGVSSVGYSQNGISGQSPGGGGSGGCAGFGNYYSGGNGGFGQIIIYW